MPRVDGRNIILLLVMSIVGFYVTTYILKKFGD